MMNEDVILQSMALHYVGNKSHEEPLLLAHDLVSLEDEVLKKVLLSYFLDHFDGPEWYNFSFTNGQLMHNAIYAASSAIFDEPGALLTHSLDIARHLYSNSAHPNIKSGELLVAYLKNVQVDDELTDCLGIFKLEQKRPFLKVDRQDQDFVLSHELGYFTGKLDKGCLIYHTDRDIGYRVRMVDTVSSGAEAKYWREHFLYVQPAQDEYFQTRHVMGMTKSFVNDQMPLEFGVEPKEKMEYLDRSLDYFRNVPHYSEEDFAQAVFEDLDVSQAFQDYRDQYAARNAVHIEPSFDINEQAVKKSAGKFKSVIKLDKNFHIYVHGDRTLLERGVDEKGRRFYRLFYQEEH